MLLWLHLGHADPTRSHTWWQKFYIFEWIWMKFGTQHPFIYPEGWPGRFLDWPLNKVNKAIKPFRLQNKVGSNWELWQNDSTIYCRRLKMRKVLLKKIRPVKAVKARICSSLSRTWGMQIRLVRILCVESPTIFNGFGWNLAHTILASGLVIPIFWLAFK